VNSLCDAFAHTVLRVPDRIALRSLGGERELTWSDYAVEVASRAAMLIELGVRPGQSVALMMGNCIEFHLLDTAIMHVGAVPVSIYNTLRPRDIAYILGNSGAKWVFAQSCYVSTLSEIDDEDACPAGIVSVDGTVIGATDLRCLLMHDTPLDLAQAAGRVRPQDLATISYTSGTTGPPKGVELSHEAILRSIAAIDDAFGVIDGARMVSFLPMAHVAERMFSHWRGITGGFTITPCPHPSEVGPYLLDVRPEYVFSPPRLFEKLRAAVEVRFDSECDPAQRALNARGLQVGAAMLRYHEEGATAPDHLRKEFEGLGPTVFTPALASVGLDQTRVALTGSAPVPPELVRYLLAIGLPIFEGWGMSEVTAFGSFNRPGDTRAGTVGHPLCGAEIRLAEDGEILFRSPWMMSGYRGQPELTAETIGADGWLRTGDIGAYADGRLRIVDRKKELIISSFGKNMSPSNIEFAVKSASPLVGQVCVIGDAKPFVTALIVVDSTVADALDGRRPDLPPHSDPAVLQAVESAVSAANTELSQVERVKRHRVLDAEWLPGGDELSPTMKLKRRRILEKHHDIIEQLYSHQSH